MPRYAAFLRGVSPMNAKMPDLKRAFEEAGFTGVKTVLSSGNVVFDARQVADSSLRRAAEAAVEKRLGRAFLTVVRPLDLLRELLESDPYKGLRLEPAAKRIVTFLADEPATRPKLPLEQGGARLLALRGKDVIGLYLPNPKGPVFMSLIEKTFGKDQTTRTWDTVGKVARG
jgi:uncharacterized protein (DUF1697 family)